VSRVLKEILFAAGAVGLALLFIIQSRNLTASAAMLPRLLAGLIIVLSGLMALSAVRAHQRMVRAGEVEPVDVIDVRRVCLFMVIIIAYVTLMEPLGYFVVTPLFIVGTYMYLRALSLKWSLLVALGFCVLVYGVFVKVLYLPVPLGLLEPLLGR
jgi:hypothetical protein